MRFVARRCSSLLHVAALVGSWITAAVADDGRGLGRGGDPKQVSISGLSSGAAMAVQYAVAHSASVTAVGTIAGPQWGCAEGSLARAVNACMCGRTDLEPTINTARRLAATGAIDPLTSGKPQVLRCAWLFQSPADETANPRSGEANAAFLAAFIGVAPQVDHGNRTDGSDQAGHGIISPDGADSCGSDGAEASFVRRCGAEDNAGKLFHTLFGEGSAFDPSQRVQQIPEGELWTFDQQHLIDKVRSSGAPIASDYYNPFWFGWPSSSRRRRNFDMATTGYIYVPPSCRPASSACRVHVALHGCKQDARVFALRAGYNNWAEHYRTIIVYPALAPGDPVPGAVCQFPALDRVVDQAWIEPNPNGCWDWWGYLDADASSQRYLTKQAPQMRVLEAIVTELTVPAR